MIDFDSETKVLDIEIFTQLTIADMNSSIAIILLFSQGQKKMHTHTHTRARTHARAYICICIYIYVYVYIYICICIYMRRGRCVHAHTSVLWGAIFSGVILVCLGASYRASVIGFDIVQNFCW